MRTPTTNRNGFTLIEAIVAIVVLSVAMPSMMWSIREAQMNRANPVLSSRARWLAVSKLEDVIADRHSVTRGYDYLITGNYPDEPSIAGYNGFSRRVLLDETTVDLVTPGDGYMIATVEVAWTDAGGSNQTLVVATVLTEYAP